MKRLRGTGTGEERGGRGQSLTCWGLHRGELLGRLRVHQDKGQLHRHVPGRERSSLWSRGTTQGGKTGRPRPRTYPPRETTSFTLTL